MNARSDCVIPVDADKVTADYRQVDRRRRLMAAAVVLSAICQKGWLSTGRLRPR